MAIEPFIDTMFCELTDEEANAILGHIRRTWRLGACRNCDGTFYQLLAQKTFNFTRSPEIMMDAKSHERPTACISCTTCGEMRFLDLTVAGLYERMPRRQRDKPAPGPTTGPYR
ncbi:MAG: hypothetical protein AB7T06_25820 [Kofleriaceae bacterium]